MSAHTYEILLALGVLAPLVSFWLLVFFGPRLGKPAAGWFAVVLGMGVPLALASYVLVGWLGETSAGKAELTQHAFRFTWAMLGDVPVTMGIKLDSLTVAMYFMVAFVAFWIFVFSVGYMAGHSDEVAHQCKYWRFFAYLSLFGFSMLGLVVSSSLLFLFIFWELVGLCSYLLIGFYFDQKVPQYAQMKAFITNRVGDFGFLIGLMLVFLHLGTLDLDQAARTFAEQYHSNTGIFASSYTLFGWTLATIMGIGLFCGAMGKSAQFPLHVWLPDAMAGPTPVSALIHAATMVAAGVYLVARVFRLMTPEALMFIATIGCLTLFLMALVAIVQNDIKKCLAYSTLSQLGYMIFGMGVGAWVAALFHLITHAFFKAMLFLGSGQVIEGCHHEQDMRKLGGLWRKMPVTGTTFLIGVLAIAGFGIPGTHFGLGGFFSKDEILAVAYARAFEWETPQDYEDHGHAQYPGLEGKVRHAVLVKEPVDGEITLPPMLLPGERRHLGATPEIRERVMLRLYSSMEWDEEADDECAEPLAAGDDNTWAVEGFWPDYDASATGLTTYESFVDGRDFVRVDDMLAAQEEAGAGHGDTHAQPEHDAGTPDEGHATHGPADLTSIFKNTPPLPKWMFWLAIFTAYVTPFYMMRCWWMTFAGKPRDHHVYDHAHESPLMYVPLVVLAIGTFVASYWLFRPMIANAAHDATAAVGVMAIDGTSHAPAISSAHHWLVYGVGGAFLVGFAIAILIYRHGLAMAERIRNLPVVSLLYELLTHKYYFDEVYDFVWIKGCVAVAKVCRFVDTWFVDLVFNLSAALTARFAAFTGWIMDAEGVDGIVNGISKTAKDIGNVLRLPQTGRIRNYVLFAAAAATIVICVIVFGFSDGGNVAATATAGM